MRTPYTLITAAFSTLLLLGSSEATAQTHALVAHPAAAHARSSQQASLHHSSPGGFRGTNPVNDECANATALTVVGLDECGTSATPGDNTTATQSVGNPSCDASNAGYADVWYSFNSGSNSTVYVTLAPDAAMTDYCYAVYQACDTTADIACSVLPGGAEAVAVAPNTDYSIRVYSNLQYGVGGPHTICVAVDNSPLPVNDLCSSVTPVNLAIGGSANFTGTTAGATIDGDYDPADLTPYPATWHAFTITDACADLQISYCGTDPAFTNYFVVVSTDCPLSDSSVVFSTSSNTTACADGNVTVVFYGLTAGTYYYPVLSEIGTAYGPYTIDVAALPCAQPPANDDCAGAINLTAGTSCEPTTGTTLLATESQPADSCNGFLGIANDDVWYSFTATATDMTVAVLGGDGFDAVVELFEGTCGNFSEIGCADATVGTETEEIQQAGLVIGQTYYFRLFNYGTGAPAVSTFTVCVVEGAGTNIGIGEIASADLFTVYPNPTAGDVSISWAGASGKVNIELLDMTGRIAFSEQRSMSTGQQYALPLKGRLAQGTYTVRLTGATDRAEQRIVLN
ncbi:MAG: T9SS type A sorting domain-containing protein [Flavobacteriales bacterium]|nr:T9SS type A sorting domain-containing protein [Flavobacteriales bacterium]